MALTDAQLLTIKTKIETDKILPRKAIKELFPDEKPFEVRQQLFVKYDAAELRSHTKVEATPLTKEEKLARNAQQLIRMEERKAKLEAEKTALEAEE